MNGIRVAWADAVPRRALLFLLLLFFPRILAGYSVLTHEAVIDASWQQSIQPVLLARFPGATSDQLREARAYAYAGCILQDMGYYPMGSKFFSNLVHYVRSGDFVVNLVREAQNRNELAFALGALAHYAGDTQGHSIAVNQAVPLAYPKLAHKFGDKVTYEDDPAAHIKVEFGFDVLQVARGHYAPTAYHDFIGFEVALPVLQRAFYRTYSLQLADLFPDLDEAVGTYRHTVSSIIPQATKVAWHMKKDELTRDTPGLTRRRFTYILRRADYRKEWGRAYQQPGFGTRLLALIIRILPKVGPLQAFAFKPPSAEADRLFMTSFLRTAAEYGRLLKQANNPGFQLPNRDFDTGELTRPVEYRMADEAYAQLAMELAARPQANIDPALRKDVLDYFGNLDLPFAAKRDAKKWRAAVSAIETLKAPVASSNSAAAMPY
jgi:hypothetical protein